MRSELLGTRTPDVEVDNVSPFGSWLLVDERELFLSFEAFPWFKVASVRQLAHVERPSPHHRYWPALDEAPRLSSTLRSGRANGIEITDPLGLSVAAFNRVLRGLGCVPVSRAD